MLAGKKTLSINDTEGQSKGQSRFFMARDSAASEMSVARVLFIKHVNGVSMIFGRFL